MTGQKTSCAGKVQASAIKLLVALLMLFLSLLGYACSSSAPSEEREPVSRRQLGPPDRVDVVYFYPSSECNCMVGLRNGVRQTVAMNFPIEYTSGKVTVSILASDDEANAALAKKFKTGPTGLFINLAWGETEEIVAAEEIWKFGLDQDKFKAYLKELIEKSLRGEL